MTTIWTIGHSNRTADAFLGLLRTHAIEQLVDVRRFPGSRRLPQLGQEALQRTLAEIGMAYTWMESLGGRRSAKDAGDQLDEASVAGWQNSAFRAYAAYMQTPTFAQAVDALVALAQPARTAIMCSESVWWQCHRRLISDALVARGHTVLHILNESTPKPHAMTEFAHVEDSRVTYPPPLFAPQQAERSPPRTSGRG